MTTYVYQSATFSNIPTAAEKKKIRVILGRLEKEGLIEKTGRIAGEYRILKKDCEAVDWINASTETVKRIQLERQAFNLDATAGDDNAPDSIRVTFYRKS